MRRSAGDVELVGHETNESVMMFEETLPAGAKSLFPLHRDSDEVLEFPAIGVWRSPVAHLLWERNRQASRVV